MSDYAELVERLLEGRVIDKHECARAIETLRAQRDAARRALDQDNPQRDQGAGDQAANADSACPNQSGTIGNL